MSSIRRTLLSNHQRLKQATGGPAGHPRHTDLRAADMAVQGVLEFHHLGSHPTRVGRSGIDWSGPQHRHQEWRAQLNRFFHLPVLAEAYERSGKEEYAEAARDYLEDWIKAHPPREGWALAPYDNTLNLAIRMLNWLGSLPRFLPARAFDDALVERILASAAVQLDFLCANMTDHMNWRIAQADSLLTAGILLQGLPGAERWREVGVSALNDAFHRQVLPDGAHVERNPSYHGWMTRVFTKCWRLGRSMPELGLAVRTEPLARMHDYALATTRPNGALNAMHDCTGRREGTQANAALAARAAFRREAGLPDELPATSQFFPHAGQAFLRDGWGEDATYLTFDATRWGGGHCHLSRNAVQLHAFGRSLVVDPGSLTYEASDPMASYGKSTRAHSTVNLNGWNQCEADPESRFVSLPGYDLVASLYQGGYWAGRYLWRFEPDHGRGLYAQHHRTLLWVRGRCIVVLDLVVHDYDSEPPALESNWQLCEGPIEVDPAGRWVRTRHPQANVLLLFPLQAEGMRLTVHEGELDPPLGWLPGEGRYVPAPMVSLRAERCAGGFTDLAAVMVPFRGAEPPRVQAEAYDTAAGHGTARLRLRWADGSTDDVLWTGRFAVMIGAQEELETDASLVHLHRDPQGELVRGLVFDGTYVKPWSPRPRPAPEAFLIP